MKIIAIIPARMGSSRFPGKPMAQILGKPMIGHVYERVRRAPILDDVVVATCDEEVRTYIASIGGRAIMTSPTHQRASDRCAEALELLEAMDSVRYDVVVMVQGDEPMVRAEMIDEALAPMIADPAVEVVNLLGPLTTETELRDPNCIKVVVDRHMNALYFSREPIPNKANFDLTAMGKQVCVIPFTANYLRQYTTMSPTPLEEMESIDMLRVLEHGGDVRMASTKYQSWPVDTPADLERVQDRMRMEND